MSTFCRPSVDVETLRISKKPAGYDYLDSARSDSIWNEIKHHLGTMVNAVTPSTITAFLASLKVGFTSSLLLRPEINLRQKKHNTPLIISANKQLIFRMPMIKIATLRKPRPANEALFFTLRFHLISPPAACNFLSYFFCKKLLSAINIHYINYFIHSLLKFTGLLVLYYY